MTRNNPQMLSEHLLWAGMGRARNSKRNAATAQRCLHGEARCGLPVSPKTGPPYASTQGGCGPYTKQNREGGSSKGRGGLHLSQRNSPRPSISEKMQVAEKYPPQHTYTHIFFKLLDKFA